MRLSEPEDDYQEPYTEQCSNCGGFDYHEVDGLLECKECEQSPYLSECGE